MIEYAPSTLRHSRATPGFALPHPPLRRVSPQHTGSVRRQGSGCHDGKLRICMETAHADFWSTEPIRDFRKCALAFLAPGIYTGTRRASGERVVG